jgi:hypothetical protein
MKKLVIATTIALAAGVASAAELGLNYARDYAGNDREATGITIGTNVGALGVTAGFDRATKGTNDQDRYSLIASREVAKLGAVSFAVKGGGAFINNQRGADGYALVVGAGASFPVTKTVSLGLDVTRQMGQDRISQFDGNRATAGLKVSF